MINGNWCSFRDRSFTSLPTYGKGCSLKEKNLLPTVLFFRSRTFSDGGWCAGKQTEDHRNCHPCTKWRKIYQMYQIPLTYTQYNGCPPPPPTHTHTFFTSQHPHLHFSQTPKKGYDHRIQPSQGTGLKILNIRALTKVYKLPVKMISRRSLSSKGLSEILRDIGISTCQISRIEEKINRTTTLHKWICNLTPFS